MLERTICIHVNGDQMGVQKISVYLPFGGYHLVYSSCSVVLKIPNLM